jgi:hypothetical protein
MTDHFDQKYTLQFFKKSHHQQLQEIFGGRNFTSATYNDINSQCNPSIYDDMVNLGEPRFYLIYSCITVTGNVTLVHSPSDGDVVFAVALDEPYQNLLTTANFNSKMNGGIWVELICQSKNNSKELVLKGDCIAGTSPQFLKPQVGDRVSVTGAYIIDIREGGHAEIHPASSMTKLS